MNDQDYRAAHKALKAVDQLLQAATTGPEMIAAACSAMLVVRMNLAALPEPQGPGTPTRRSKILLGSRSPRIDEGQDQDLYVNTATNDVWMKRDGQWIMLMNMAKFEQAAPRGPVGPLP